MRTNHVEGTLLQAFLEIAHRRLLLRGADTDKRVDRILIQRRSVLEHVCLLAVFFDRFHEALILERLDKIIDNTQPQGLLNVFHVVGRRHHDDI